MEKMAPEDLKELLRAYGPEKKAAGNYYTPGGTRRMEKEFASLTISHIPDQIYNAD